MSWVKTAGLIPLSLFSWVFWPNWLDWFKCVPHSSYSMDAGRLAMETHILSFWWGECLYSDPLIYYLVTSEEIVLLLCTLPFHYLNMVNQYADSDFPDWNQQKLKSHMSEWLHWVCFPLHKKTPLYLCHVFGGDAGSHNFSAIKGKSLPLINVFVWCSIYLSLIFKSWGIVLA